LSAVSTASEPLELAANRLDHPRVAVAETGDRGAAAGIEIAPAIPIDQRDARAADRDRILRVRMPIEDVTHAAPTP